jgi:hypothetical protein
VLVLTVLLIPRGAATRNEELLQKENILAFLVDLSTHEKGTVGSANINELR